MLEMGKGEVESPRTVPGPAEVEEVVDRGATVRLLRSEELIEAADGARLVVVDKRPLGETRGRVAVLVHGLRGIRGNWDLPSRSFQNFLVTKGYRTVCVEMRGSGRARAEGSPPPQSIRELLELDLKAILDFVGAGPGSEAILLGHSLGALLCCLAAGRWPRRVAAVVAFAPPHSPGRGQGAVRAASRAFLRLSRKARTRGIIESEAVSTLLVRGRALLDRWPLPPYSRSVRPGSMGPGAGEELEAARAREPAFAGLLVDLARMTAGFDPEGLDIEPTLAELRAPLLCMVGDRDEIVPPVAVEPLMESVASEVKEYRVVGDSSWHVGHADIIVGSRAPELVWPHVVSWIERV